MVKNNERGGGGECRSEIGKNPLSATYYARTADRSSLLRYYYCGLDFGLVWADNMAINYQIYQKTSLCCCYISSHAYSHSPITGGEITWFAR